MKKELSRTLRTVTLLIFSLCLFQSAAVAVDYTHELKVKKMTFAWKIQQQKLYVRLTAPTTGWVAIGFNPTYRMQDANFVMGYVKKGKVKVTDAFGVRPKEHINDTAMKGTNNITDVSGSETGKNTTIEFAIPMDSGDAADKRLTADEYTDVLLAFAKKKDNFTSRHRFRTSLKINLANGRHK
jgi:DOMON domain-containing protein